MAESVLFGSYELLDRIGEGGMAEVWRARSRGVAGFEKTVVIKRVLPSLMAKKTFAELLIREAKIAALLSHPNIVQIFDLGEEQGAYFIAMEYSHGKDLGAAMSHKPRGGRTVEGLSIELKLWIIAQVCKALDYAHRRRGADGRPLSIVHRDVSPQNVLLGYEGAVKVADFGIARADDQDLGRGEDPKVLRGKYAYMSPEQARGEPLDKRSDLFSLGIVLYEIVVGKRLFRAQTTRETLARVRKADVPALDAAALGIPKGLVPILMKALAGDREQRYASAAALLTDLNQLLFELGAAQVDESELADAMHRMFPPDDAASPNKLRVDLMLRAYDDASLVATPTRTEVTPLDETPSGTKEHTVAFPASRRIRSETCEAVLLAVAERGEDGDVFESVVAAFGGYALPAIDGVREAVFGHQVGIERGAVHAGRAALELERRLLLDGPTRIDPVPPMALVAGSVTRFEVGTVEPQEALHATGCDLVSRSEPGKVRVSALLSPLLSRTFVVSEDDEPIILGFRAREDRDALAIRQRAPLAGRRDEVRALTEALARAAEGAQASTFFIVGEPGSGKSRLIAELVAVASGQDVAVVRGRGDEAQTAGSYGALAEVFRDLTGLELGDAPAERFGKVDRLRVLGLKPREVRIVGELLGLAYPVAREERAGRPRGLELTLAARKALRAVAADRAAILVLEDVHWMDDSTRQILPLLIAGLERSRVLTVITGRPGTPLPVDGATCIVLEALDERSTARLFGARVGSRVADEELVERALAESAGNPGWIEGLAAALLEDGQLEVTDGVARVVDARPTPITPQHRSMIAAWLADLRPLDKTVVRAAAIFEQDVPIDTLAGVSGAPAEQFDAVMRRLLVQRLLVSGEGELPGGPPRSWWPGEGAWGGGAMTAPLPKRVHMPGSLLRRAVLDAIGDMERRRLHGSAAAILERQGAAKDDDRIGVLAYHASRSVDRRRATDYLVRAAEVARAKGRHAETARRLIEAARIVRESGEDNDGEGAAVFALDAADVALDAGETDLLDEALAEAEATTVARSDARTRVRVALARARGAARRERWQEAADVLEQVSPVIAGLDDPVLRGSALVELGQLESEAGRPEAAVTILSQAAEDLARTDASELAGFAWCRLAGALARTSRVERAEEAVASALALTARLGEGPLRHLSLAAMGVVQDARGALGAAAARFREAAEVAEQQGDEVEAAYAYIHGAIAALEAGREPDAAVMAEAATRLSRRQHLEAIGCVSAAVQAALAVRADTDTSWLPGIVRAVDRLETLGRHEMAARALSMLAVANVALGDPGAAVRTFERAAASAGRAGHGPLEQRLLSRARELAPRSD